MTRESHCEGVQRPKQSSRGLHSDPRHVLTRYVRGRIRPLWLCQRKKCAHPHSMAGSEMTTTLRFIPFAITCLCTTAAAQAPSSPVADALRSISQRAGTNLVAAAEEMPA